MKKPTKKTVKKLVRSPLRVGNNVLIRTVTHHQLGRVAAVTRDTVLLSNASWLACSARRFGEYLATGKDDATSEIEKVPGAGVVEVGRGAIIDAFDWPHPLPEHSR